MWMKSRRWLMLVGVVGCASNPPPVAATAPASAPPAPATAAGAPASPPPAKLRPPEEILADAVKATGGAAAWNAHKTAHYKVETTLQGMGMGGTGERYQTRTDKSLMTMTMAGLGVVREGTNGKVAWTEDPVLGIRYLDGVEAEQTRIASSWNADLHAGELFAKLEAASESGPDGAPLECIVATPKLGSPLRSCYDAKTHLQVSQSGVRAGPQGDMPFKAIIRDWREIAGVKIPFESNTQLGPITTVDRVTSVTFDEPIDDKMFDPPKPAQAPPHKK